MNTIKKIQQAINDIEISLTRHKGSEIVKDAFACETLEDAVQALEKQKSIKPLNQRYINKELIGECPSCRLQWDVAFYQRYCSNCGQKLDWS
ncbi:MAG TPA: hypothetical protein VFC79_11480 [Tissierellaceae bacterium]|nr:hypothetical protein [Tissierellaceae bacterium]